MEIIRAGLESLQILTDMNRQLREDEQIDNYMTSGELTERMRGFLLNDLEYRAYLFSVGREVVGYTLVKLSEEPVYIRQFFIHRDSRRKGYGREGMRLLKKVLNTGTIELDVLVWNPAAVEFYRSVGFKDRLIRMRLE